MSALERSATSNAGNVFLQAILAVVLIAVVVALAILGLDALNEFMARGFVSMRGPGS